MRRINKNQSLKTFFDSFGFEKKEQYEPTDYEKRVLATRKK